MKTIKLTPKVYKGLVAASGGGCVSAGGRWLKPGGLVVKLCWGLEREKSEGEVGKEIWGRGISVKNIFKKKIRKLSVGARRN